MATSTAREPHAEEADEEFDDLPDGTRRAMLIGVAFALLCAGALSFPTLYSLARLIGFPPHLAWMLPGCLDGYAGTSIWFGRNLPAGHPARAAAHRNARGSLALTVACNGLYHLLAIGGALVSPGPRLALLIAVSCLPPIVVDRLLHLQALATGRNRGIHRGSGATTEPSSRTRGTRAAGTAVVPQAVPRAPVPPASPVPGTVGGTPGGTPVGTAAPVPGTTGGTPNGTPVGTTNGTGAPVPGTVGGTLGGATVPVPGTAVGTTNGTAAPVPGTANGTPVGTTNGTGAPVPMLVPGTPSGTPLPQAGAGSAAGTAIPGTTATPIPRPRVAPVPGTAPTGSSAVPGTEVPQSTGTTPGAVPAAGGTRVATVSALVPRNRRTQPRNRASAVPQSPDKVEWPRIVADLIQAYGPGVELQTIRAATGCSKTSASRLRASANKTKTAETSSHQARLDEENAS